MSQVADFITWGPRTAVAGHWKWVDIKDSEIADSVNWVLEEGGPNTKIHIVVFSKHGGLVRTGKLLGSHGLIAHVMCISNYPLTEEEALTLYDETRVANTVPA